MKIKSKLTLGVGFLFILIFLLAALSTFYINALNKDTHNILVANYNTLDYTRNMLNAIDENLTLAESSKKFSENLNKQQKNITEIGEKELTEQLSADYNKLLIDPNSNELLKAVRKDLTDIMLLNMQAIERKSNIAKHTANEALLWIPILGTLCFLIAFILVINLPGNIANPIRELTISIKEIAGKNYKERVHFESHNEFGELAHAFNVMAQKLEEYDNSKLARILIEKKRIETLINNMKDPVIGLDENWNILFVNEEAYKVIGLKQEDLIGICAKDIALSNDLVRNLLQNLTTNKNTHKPLTEKPLKIFANNKESYFEKEIIHIDITPTGEETSKHFGYVIVLKNITPFKELDFAKTNFIATVSHEFKTPISSIKMSLQLLEKEQIGNLNEEQKNLVESIKDDANRLLKITGELLNMSQVESGNIQLSMIPVDPKEILMYAVNATKTQAEQKQIKIEIKCPDFISEIQADNEKTSWVLINLISNAILHSYINSSIVISLDQQNGKVNFTVKDTGPGIASKYKEKIFDRYFRVPGTDKEGTGLGLAICKEFIEAQGGQINVDSELGLGSTFIVSLNKA
jgi:NtrC-family two-component system sensor histidine kinase KinB